MSPHHKSLGWQDISFETLTLCQRSAKLVMDWRNDPVTLSQSFHSQPKTWPDFFAEFSLQYFLDPTLPCLFAREGDQRVAFLRFARMTSPLEAGLKTCHVSINVAPDHRGRGVGTAVIKAMLSFLRRLSNIELVVAYVKPDNAPSLKMLENAGFMHLDSLEYKVPDTGESIPVRRLTTKLTTHARLPGSARSIGPGQPCFVIAEAGSNWRMGTPARDLKMARALIDVAAEAGADAVKFQTYRPETTYVCNAGESDYLCEAGIKESIASIFADLAMPYEMVAELAEYAHKQQILFMSSPFSRQDFQAVDPFVSLHKIASYEISHLRLLEEAAASGKPLVLSTGASSIEDISWAVNFFASKSQAQVCLMQCTARYPAPFDSLNLSAIPHLKAMFGVPVGLSDHSRHPLIAPVAAVALGADLIEKHYTLDNRLPGPDHAFALTPEELKQMVTAIRQAQEVGSDGHKVVLPEEEELFHYARRGLQAIRAIEPGERFLEGENFDILRPGKQQAGMHPRFIEKVSASHAARRIEVGSGIQEGDLSEN